MKKSSKGYFILVSICSFLLTGGIMNIFDPNYENKSGTFTLLVFLGFWIVFGIYKIIKIKKFNSSTKYLTKTKRMEHEILNIIKDYNGKVTLMEVAERSSFTMSEVEEFLTEMCTKGLGDINITDSGICVYVFDGFLSQKERNNSHSIFGN